jgi:hypothetical protein
MPLNVSLYLNIWHIKKKESFQFVAGALKFPNNIYKKKVKQSHYRRGVAQRVLRKLRFPDYVTMAQDGGKVVSLTHRPSLPPGNTAGTHFR